MTPPNVAYTPPVAGSAGRVRYRKLPGHLRLLFGGASFWAAEDHFLLVRSSRFSERYKRFYFSEIQGIAVAEARRFHVSSRAMGIAVVWLVAVVAAQRFPTVRNAVAWSGLIFPVAWLLVSLLASCRCRIYTAVSNDEIPSVYRRWSARRFLAAVEPLIAARQGAVPPNWAELAEQSGAAPAPFPVSLRGATGQSRTQASAALIVTLFLGAGIEVAHWPQVLDRWIVLVSILSIIAATVAVMVHRRKGLIKSSMQTLAIVTLVAVGLMSYGRILVTAGMASYKAAQTKSTVATTFDYAEPSDMRPYTASLYVLLGVIGVILSFGSSPEPGVKIAE
jgi:hypothetical protein